MVKCANISRQFAELADFDVISILILTVYWNMEAERKDLSFVQGRFAEYKCSQYAHIHTDPSAVIMLKMWYLVITKIHEPPCIYHVR